MKIKRGFDGHFYAVFRDENEAWESGWRYLFSNVLHRPMECFGAYLNAWRII